MSDDDTDEDVATGSYDPENKRMTIDFSDAVDDEEDEEDREDDGLDLPDDATAS